VVPLTAPDESGSSTGCLEADREEILEIMLNHEAFSAIIKVGEFVLPEVM
jgi:hypothetical protein